MSWRAILECRHWIARPPETGRLLARGTLVLEFVLPQRPGATLTLVDYSRDAGWARALSLVLSPEGELRMTERQGPATVRAALTLPLPEGESCVRVHYAWDAPARRGRLSLELACAGRWASVPVADPHPIPEEDLAALGTLPGGVMPVLAAWSDDLEPVGPLPGLAAGTPIETASGLRPVELIGRGDLVRTSDTGFQPVRHVISREVPAAGRHAPILLAAPALGLAADILVAPHQRMLIGGADAEYLFGADAVLVEARHLAPIAAMPASRSAATVRYHQLILDRHECISIAGSWGETQFVDAAAGRPAARAGTVLEPLEGPLPAHSRCANPMLRPYEAVVLVSAIGA